MEGTIHAWPNDVSLDSQSQSRGANVRLTASKVTSRRSSRSKSVKSSPSASSLLCRRPCLPGRNSTNKPNLSAPATLQLLHQKQSLFQGLEQSIWWGHGGRCNMYLHVAATEHKACRLTTTHHICLLRFPSLPADLSRSVSHQSDSAVGFYHKMYSASE